MADVTHNAPNQSYAFGSSQLAWFAVAALSVTNIVAFLERQIITLMIDPIKADLNLSDTEIGLLLGLFFTLFASFTGILFGWLADRGSRKWIIIAGAVVWSCATMACGLGRDFGQLAGARLAVGVGQATITPSAMSIISDYFPRERLTRALSFFSSSVAIGAGLALMLGGAIIQFVDTMGAVEIPFLGLLSGWKLTFVLVGACGSAVLIALLFMKEPPRRGLLSTDNKGSLGTFLGKNARFYVALILGFSVQTIAAMAVLIWTPVFFMRVHHWSAFEIGSSYGLGVAVIGTVGVLLGAQISEWMDRRGYRDTNMRLAAIALGLATIPAVLAYVATDARLALVLVLAAQFLTSLATGPVMAALQLVTPNELRGRIMAIFAFVSGFVGMMFGPLIVGIITDKVFGDILAVGQSIALAVLVVKPFVVLLFVWGMRPYRDGLAEANARASNAAST